MSLIGILASNLFASGATQSSQNTQNTQSAGGAPSTFQQLKAEFQQLGQDLQSGNLTQAQQDYAALSQNLPNTGSAATSPVLQALTQLGQDLNAGNLQAAQQDYATAQQDAQQQASQVTGHHGHHHHHSENSQNSQSFSSSSSSSSNSINQAFATLQNDLQHIGGYVPIALNGAGGVSDASSAAAGNLNVNV